MAFVSFRTIAPYNEVLVNPAKIVAISPEPSTPDGESELLAEANRQIHVLENIDSVAGKLGANFVRLEAASTTIAAVYVNKRLVLQLLPHPQVANVVQVHGRGRQIAVKGTLQEVAQKLS